MGGTSSKKQTTVSSKEGCCSVEKCGKCYLVGLNSLLILAGLVFVLLSIWLGVKFKGYGEVVSGAFVWAPLGVGLGMVLIALLGCCGVIFKNKASLVLYTIICSLLLLASLVFSIFLLVEIGYLNKAADAENSADLSKQGAIDATTVEAVVFNHCCVSSVQNWSKYEVGICPCKTTTNNGCTCYQSQSEYEVLSSHFDNEVCSVLEDLTVVYGGKTVPIVGDTANGGCGGGDPKIFQIVVAEYAQTELAPGAWGIFATSMILLVGVVLACCIICKRPSAREKGYERQDDDIHLDKPVDIHERGEGIELRSHGQQQMSFA